MLPKVHMKAIFFSFGQAGQESCCLWVVYGRTLFGLALPRQLQVGYNISKYRSAYERKQWWGNLLRHPRYAAKPLLLSPWDPAAQSTQTLVCDIIYKLQGCT